MFSREETLKVRVAFIALTGNPLPARWPGLRFSVTLTAANNCLTCCSREISASISRTMAMVSINPPLMSITHVRRKSSLYQDHERLDEVHLRQTKFQFFALL